MQSAEFAWTREVHGGRQLGGNAAARLPDGKTKFHLSQRFHVGVVEILAFERREVFEGQGDFLRQGDDRLAPKRLDAVGPPGRRLQLQADDGSVLPLEAFPRIRPGFRAKIIDVLEASLRGEQPAGVVCHGFQRFEVDEIGRREVLILPWRSEPQAHRHVCQVGFFHGAEGGSPGDLDFIEFHPAARRGDPDRLLRFRVHASRVETDGEERSLAQGKQQQSGHEGLRSGE